MMTRSDHPAYGSPIYYPMGGDMQAIVGTRAQLVTLVGLDGIGSPEAISQAFDELSDASLLIDLGEDLWVISRKPIAFNDAVYLQAFRALVIDMIEAQSGC